MKKVNFAYCLDCKIGYLPKTYKDYIDRKLFKCTKCGNFTEVIWSCNLILGKRYEGYLIKEKNNERIKKEGENDKTSNN